MVQMVNGQKNTGENHPPRPLLESSPRVFNSTAKDICPAQNNPKSITKLPIQVLNPPPILPFTSTDKPYQTPQKKPPKNKKTDHDKTSENIAKCEEIILGLNTEAESTHKDRSKNVHFNLDSKLEELLTCIENNPDLLRSDRNNILLNNVVLDQKPEAIQRLIACNCNVNKKTFFTRALSTAFHQLHSEKNIQLIEILIKAGAKMPQNDENIFLLYTAIQEGNIQRLVLLKKIGWDMNQPMKGYFHPFIVACREGNPDVVHTLIELKADIYGGSPIEELETFNALFSSYKKNSAERFIIFKTLLSLWPEIYKDALIEHVFSVIEKTNWSELIDFLSKVKCERIILNVNKDAEDTRNGIKLDDPVLEWEELLPSIEKNPDLLLSDKYNILLYQAVRSQKLEIVQKLLACGCDVNKKTPYNEILFFAFFQRHSDKNIELIEMLIHAGAKMAQDNTSNRFLYNSIQERNIPRLKFLKQIGWDMDRNIPDYPHPLVFACQQGSAIVVENLIEFRGYVHASKHPKHREALNMLLDSFNKNQNDGDQRLIIFKKFILLKGKLSLIKKNFLPTARQKGLVELVAYLENIDQKPWITVFFETIMEEYNDNPITAIIKYLSAPFVFVVSSILLIRQHLQNDPSRKTSLSIKTDTSINDCSAKKSKIMQSPPNPQLETLEITSTKAEETEEDIYTKINGMLTKLGTVKNRTEQNASEIKKYNACLSSKKTEIKDDDKNTRTFKSISGTKEISLDEIKKIKDEITSLEKELEELKLSYNKNRFEEIQSKINNLDEKLIDIANDYKSKNKNLDELCEDHKKTVTHSKNKPVKQTKGNTEELRKTGRPKKSIVDTSKVPQIIPPESQNSKKENTLSTLKTKKPDMPHQEPLEFKSWYSTNVCQSLLGHANMSPNFISVVFYETQEDNTKSFKNQLEQLVFLCKKLNCSAVLVCKEPGTSLHFMCCIVRDGELLVINPLGENQEIFNQILNECKAEKIISKMWTSTTKLQQKKYESKENSLSFCGSITLELSTSSQLEDFWNNLNTNTGTIDISLLLPQSLKNLLQSKNQQDYQKQISKIHMKHCKQVDSYTDKNKLSDSQAVFHALVIKDFTIDNVEQMPEYQSLIQKKSPNSQIIVHRHNPNPSIPQALLLVEYSLFSNHPKKPKKPYKKATPEEAQKTAMASYLQISAQLSTLTSFDFEIKTEQNICKLSLALHIMKLFNALLAMHGGEQNKIFTLMTNLCNLRNPLIKCVLKLETDINAFVSFCCEVNTAFQSIHEDYKKSISISHEKLFAFCQKIQESAFYNTLWQEWENYQLKLKSPCPNDIQENIKNIISYSNEIVDILKVVTYSAELRNYPDRATSAEALLMDVSQMYVDFIQKHIHLLFEITDRQKLETFFNDVRNSRNKSGHEAKNFRNISETQIMNFKSRIETTILPILNASEKTIASTSTPRRTINF